MQVVSDFSVVATEIHWDPENPNYSTNGQFDPAKEGGALVSSEGMHFSVKRGIAREITFAPVGDVINNKVKLEPTGPALYSQDTAELSDIGNPAKVITGVKITKENSIMVFEITSVKVNKSPSGISVPSDPIVETYSIEYVRNT